MHTGHWIRQGTRDLIWICVYHLKSIIFNFPLTPKTKVRLSCFVLRLIQLHSKTAKGSKSFFLQRTVEFVLGAIQIISDTFLAYFRPPPPCVIWWHRCGRGGRGKLFLTFKGLKCLQKLYKSQKMSRDIFENTPLGPSPLCHLVTLSRPS